MNAKSESSINESQPFTEALVALKAPFWVTCVQEVLSAKKWFLDHCFVKSPNCINCGEGECRLHALFLGAHYQEIGGHAGFDPVGNTEETPWHFPRTSYSKRTRYLRETVTD